MIKEIRIVVPILVCAVLFCISAPSLHAQFGVRVPIKVAARNSTSTGPRITTTARRTIVIQKVNNRVVTKMTMVKTSNLSVSTEPGAEVSLKSLLASEKPIKPVNANKNGIAVFQDLKPGKYKIIAKKDGFDTQEQDEVVILPKTTHGLDMDLKPITYSLKIETNLTDGEVRYAQAVYKGLDAKGSIIADEIGNYCIVKVQKNGEAVVPDLKKGYYNLDIRPAALEYQSAFVGVNVPDDTEQDDEKTSSDIKTFQIDLEKNQHANLWHGLDKGRLDYARRLAAR